MKRSYKLSTRILTPGVVIILCFAAAFAWILNKVATDMYEAKNVKTQHLVESAWGVVDFYAKQAKSGVMPLAEAQAKARETIKNLRYDKDEYFWINDLEPRMVMHPIKADMDGKGLADNKDPNGKALFVAMAEVCKKQGAGFVDYCWPKPGFSAPVPKISYVKLVPDWGWIIGSGVYLDDVQAEVSSTLYLLLGVFGAIGLAGLSLAFGMAKSISRPILRVVESLTEGAKQTVAAASQVSSASQSLAEGASEQAASLEETSASLEEISSMTQRNAESSTKAKELANQARKAADVGASDMETMSAAMEGIKTSSVDISKIIRTIDEIAFQTNILALNAAVEAARAGEAGMGFAVVADEVRSLAQRAAHAAKETATKIEGAVSRTEQGVQISVKVAQGLAEIVAKVRQVDELVAEVAAASREQSQGIEQVNLAVSQMDKVTQNNAASAEESASASEQLNAQAESSNEAVAELLRMVEGSNGGSAGARKASASAVGSAVRRASSASSGARMPARKNSSFGPGRKTPPAHPLDAGFETADSGKEAPLPMDVNLKRG